MRVHRRRDTMGHVWPTSGLYLPRGRARSLIKQGRNKRVEIWRNWIPPAFFWRRQTLEASHYSMTTDCKCRMELPSIRGYIRTSEEIDFCVNSFPQVKFNDFDYTDGRGKLIGTALICDSNYDRFRWFLTYRNIFERTGYLNRPKIMCVCVRVKRDAPFTRANMYTYVF